MARRVTVHIHNTPKIRDSKAFDATYKVSLVSKTDMYNGKIVSIEAGSRQEAEAKAKEKYPDLRILSISADDAAGGHKKDVLTAKGREILASFVKEYGEKEGTSNFYASIKAGKITGAEDADEMGDPVSEQVSTGEIGPDIGASEDRKTKDASPEVEAEERGRKAGEKLKTGSDNPYSRRPASTGSALFVPGPFEIWEQARSKAFKKKMGWDGLTEKGRAALDNFVKEYGEGDGLREWWELAQKHKPGDSVKDAAPRKCKCGAQKK